MKPGGFKTKIVKLCDESFVYCICRLENRYIRDFVEHKIYE